MAPNGDRHVRTWELLTKNAVTISHFPRERTPPGLSIAVQIVVESSHESVALGVWLPVLPAAANTAAVTSICGFDYGC